MAISVLSTTALPALPPKVFFRVRELAALLGVSPRFIYHLISRGDIQSKRLGELILIPRVEVLRLAGLKEEEQG
jgi:excisionase family DNA binding protein